MKYGEIKKQILLKLDEYNGTDNMTDDADLLLKLPYAINEAVRFASYGKNTKHTWHITQGEKLNLLPETAGEHRLDPVYFSSASGFGYYFEVDDTAKITISVDDKEVAIINHVNDKPYRTFKSYRGVFENSGDVKIVFSGDYYYKIRNVCIYSVKFSSEAKVPDYNGYCIHEVPDDLYQVENVYRLEDKKVPVAFKVLGDKLYLPEDPGMYEIESTFFPIVVKEDTTDDHEVAVPKDLEYIIIQKACAFLSQDGEYAEFIADSEQGMQMLNANRGHSAPVVKVLARIG